MASVACFVVIRPQAHPPHETLRHELAPGRGPLPCPATRLCGAKSDYSRRPINPCFTRSKARGLTELLRFRLTRFLVDPGAGQRRDHRLNQTDQRRDGGKAQRE